VKTFETKPKESFWDTFKVVLQAILIAVLIRTFLFQPFSIPSGSLIPTLLVGDYLFVSKYSYGYSKHSLPFSPSLITGRIWDAAPKRGDIAVFKLPKDTSKDYIKRVIGLPGDRVQMIDGVLHINNQAVVRTRQKDYPTFDAWGKELKAPLYKETLPEGRVHDVLERDGDKGYWDNTYVYLVPQGHYFMMGDNRDNSTDSRDESSVGFVPAENLVGRAEVIFFSLKEGSTGWNIFSWPWSVRWDRVFTAIK
jgi:signal peptidase I